MALSVKTILKIYLLFFIFNICSNIFIEVMPTITPTYSQDNQDYITFITPLVNGDISSSLGFNAETEGETLLTRFKEGIEITDLFNEGIINAFLGVLKVIGQVFLFVFQLAVSILFIPSATIQILLYNFIFSNSSLFLLGLLANVSFYMMLWYIIIKRKTT